MHFYQVPRLGSYFAIKLEYNSCLYEDAFDKAVIDYGNVMDKNEGIEKLKKEDEAEDEKYAKEDKAKGKVYKKPKRHYQTYQPSAFKTQKE